MSTSISPVARIQVTEPIEPARIFVCFTDYQVWIAEQWRQRLGAATILRCSDLRMAEVLDHEADIVRVDVWFRVGSPYFRKGVQSLVDIIGGLAARHASVEVLCSTYHAPLNRALARRLAGHDKILFGGFTDGLASFLRPRLSASERRKTLLRSAWSVLSPPFVPPSLTDGIGSDWPVLRVYYAISDEEVAFWSSRTTVRRMPLATRGDVPFDGNAATLLGWAWMTIAEADWILGRLRRHLQGKRLFFKPHPSMATFAELRAFCARMEVDFVDERACVERIIQELRTGVVLGAGTTALVSLKMVFGARIETIDIKTPFEVVKNEQRDDVQIRTLFQRYGIVDLEL